MEPVVSFSSVAAIEPFHIRTHMPHPAFQAQVRDSIAEPAPTLPIDGRGEVLDGLPTVLFSDFLRKPLLQQSPVAFVGYSFCRHQRECASAYRSLLLPGLPRGFQLLATCRAHRVLRTFCRDRCRG